MGPDWIPLLEGLLIFAAVFAFGFHQLYQLRKLRKKREAERDTENRA